MAEAVFLVDINANRSAIRQALSTQEGIVSWFTKEASVPAAAGDTMTLAFADAPVPFQMRVDAVSDDQVRWTSIGEFPPHWSDTEVVFSVMDNPDADGSRVFFEHKGFAAADPMLGHTAFTWANLMNSLKSYAETGTADPFFS